ncbi:hypothetical protein GQ457_02G035680 [Hibiscus cannabinus]
MVNPEVKQAAMQPGDTTAQPTDWEEQKKQWENRMKNLENQTEENRSYLQRILTLLSKEADEIGTPSPMSEQLTAARNTGNKPTQVTILDEKERYSFNPGEPGILSTKPAMKATQASSSLGLMEEKRGASGTETKLKLGGKNNEMEETFIVRENNLWEKNMNGVTGNYLPRPKIEFQTFDGNNPRSWIRKCQKYFSIFEVPESQKLEMGTMYLVGKAETWFDGYVMKKNRLTWHEFISDLCHRSDDRNYGDVVEEFNKLLQKGSVDDYQEKFEELKPYMLQHNPHLDEDYFVSSFVSGIKEEIKHRVRVHEPKSLKEASRQAKLHELAMKVEHKKLKYYQRGPSVGHTATKAYSPATTIKPQPTPSNPRQTLLEYRRENNLCYRCGESLEISMNALTGSIGCNTLRIPGTIRGKNLSILVDSGSTHSFITPMWAREGTELMQTHPLAITVANGEKLYSNAKSNQLAWRMQGEPFTHDFRVLNLGGSDMVLGVDWLKKFSPVVLDFNEMTLSFDQGNRKVILQGETSHLHSKLFQIKECKRLQRKILKYKKAEIEKQISDMLASSIIQTSKSPFAAPCLLVKKKDGSWRMCVDYRQLNELTVKDKFPIPVVEDLLDELGGVEYFSKIDLRAGYWQIRIKREDVHKTAFRTHHGHFEIKVMPFGLTNAPATFQALMNEIFGPYLRKFVLVFFDDILVYSPSMGEHLEQLKKVLDILRANQLFAKKSKCFFGQRQVEYLGHIISARGVSTDPSKVEAMRSWPLPENLKSLRGFLGLTGYYRKFVKGYREISKPLTSMLKKDGFYWTEESRLSSEIGNSDELGRDRRFERGSKDEEACDAVSSSVLAGDA